jgi:8-oxo-dGTP pyrophosphatase MutT (NUDIX family)
MSVLRQFRAMISRESLIPLLTPISANRWASSAIVSRQAAVLVPLILQESTDQILFTQRSRNLAEHPGQISFPGGGRETIDSSPAETALRESNEEIGLRTEHIQVLGSLDPIRTSSGFDVVPVVGVIAWPVELRLDMVEVDSVFTIPLQWFVGSSQLKLEDGCPTSYAIHFPAYEGHEVWGATAMITMDLIRRLYPDKKISHP